MFLPKAAKRPNLRGFLCTKDASVYLGLSHRTLEKFRLTGAGPVFHKFGRRVLYSPEDLEQFAAERRRISTSDPGSQGF